MSVTIEEIEITEEFNSVSVIEDEEISQFLTAEKINPEPTEDTEE